MAAWTDESKQELIQDYLDANPTPETTIAIIGELATKFKGTVNSIRVTLNKAGVYVKKGTDKKADGEEAPKRTSKADAIAALTAAITDLGLEPDASIVDKLTGKAALYFAGIIRASETDAE